MFHACEMQKMLGFVEDDPLLSLFLGRLLCDRDLVQLCLDCHKRDLEQATGHDYKHQPQPEKAVCQNQVDLGAASLKDPTKEDLVEPHGNNPQEATSHWAKHCNIFRALCCLPMKRVPSTASSHT